MKRLLKKYKQELIISLSAMLVAFVVFLPVIVNNHGILYFYGDSVEQQYSFMMGFWQMFHDGTYLDPYQWALGFGNNSLSYVFYNLFSPFNLLVMPFPKEWIKYSMLYLSIIKFGFLALTGSIWLKNHTDDFRVRFAGSILLTFCGWVLYFFHINFLDPFIFYPLILSFTDRYLLYGRKRGLIISTAVLTIVNYYFMYMFVPFVCLYALFRYLIINADARFREVLAAALKFLLIILLAIGVGGIVLLPSARLIIATPRLSESVSLFSIITRADLFRDITSLFSPVLSVLDSSVFINGYSLPYSGWGPGPGLFAGSLLPLILIYFLMDRGSREKNLIVIFALVLLGFLCFPVFYRLFQGTIDTRWFYMFTLLFVYLMVYQMNIMFRDGIDRKKLLLSAILVTMLIMAFFFISYRFGFRSGSEIRRLFRYELVVIALMAVYLFTLLQHRFRYLLLLVVIADAVCSLGIFLYWNSPLDYYNFNYSDSENEVISGLKESDDGFYRVLYDNTDGIIANQPFMDQVAGNSFYLSIYNFEQEEFLGPIKSGWSMPQFQGFYGIRNLLGNKYLLSERDLVLRPVGYEKVSDSYYENRYYTGLGFLSDRTINYDGLDDVNMALLRNRILENYIITEDSGNHEYELPELETILEPYYGNYVEIDLAEPLSDANIYILNGGIPEVYVQYYEGDEMLAEEGYWQYGYIEVHIPEDLEVDRLVLNAVDVDGYGNPLEVQVMRNASDYYRNIYEADTEYPLENVVADHSRISCTASTDKPLTLFTAIPYDEGWTVKINDEQVDYQKVDMGFIGLDLEAGDYVIEFTYHIPWLNYGVIVSVASLVLLLVLSKRKMI